MKSHLSKPALHLTPEDLRARVMKTEKPAYVLGRKTYVSGRNWFGGGPLLPSHMPWPRTDIHRQPMHFWAQIDCATLNGPHDLPNSGLLLFFFDLDEFGPDQRHNGAGKVIFVAQSDIPLMERQPPSDMPQFLHAPGEQTSKFDTRVTTNKFAAEPHMFAWYDMQNVDLNWDLLSNENELSAGEIATEVTQANRKETIATAAPETYGQHALLGPEQEITNPTYGEGVRLMCLGSDDEMDWQFADDGVVEFWMSHADLREHRFDRAYAMMA
ncbi:MAG: DUF1963 domain-containing protein [Pelagimonas sp.]